MSKPQNVGGVRSANALGSSNGVRIVDRRPVPPSQREIDLYYSSRGQRRKERVVVARPTSFDEITLAVVDEISPAPPPNLDLPHGLHDAVQQSRRAMRELTSRLSAPYRHASPMLDTRRAEPNNISHLLIECIPMALYAQDALGQNVVSVYRKVAEPFRSLLEELEIEMVETSKRLEGQIVHVHGSRRLQIYNLFCMFDCPALSFFPDIFDRYSFPNAGSPPKIYLARRGARALLNNAEVERILKARGYETIYMEDFPIREQMAIAQHAKHVVAVHGAAMAFLALNRGVSTLLELFPPHTYHEHFATSLSRVDRYAVMLPDFDEAVPSRGWGALLAWKDAPFAVDLETLEQALDELAA